MKGFCAPPTPVVGERRVEGGGGIPRCDLGGLRQNRGCLGVLTSFGECCPEVDQHLGIVFGAVPRPRENFDRVLGSSSTQRLCASDTHRPGIVGAHTLGTIEPCDRGLDFAALEENACQVHHRLHELGLPFDRGLIEGRRTLPVFATVGCETGCKVGLAGEDFVELNRFFFGIGGGRPHEAAEAQKRERGPSFHRTPRALPRGCRHHGLPSDRSLRRASISENRDSVSSQI